MCVEYIEYDKTGNYTVRSGYRLAASTKSLASSSCYSQSPWWKRFWKLQFPTKIKIFLWKAYHNWIPTQVNLASHGVPTQKCCLICAESSDTTIHALWECKAQKLIKVMCKPLSQVKLPKLCSMKELLLSANDCLQSDDFELICVLLWRLWFRRNKWIHEKIWLDDNSCIMWAKQHLEDFKIANRPIQAQIENTVANVWKAPEMGMVKVNSDAAWCSKRQKFGLGIVIRDTHGRVLSSVATPISSSVSVAVAEGWALERGVLLARQLGFSMVSVESDCLGVIQALNKDLCPTSELSYVIDSIIEICNHFQKCHFSFTPRTGNQVAHHLAQLALSLGGKQLWPLGNPDHISPYVFVDIQHTSS